MSIFDHESGSRSILNTSKISVLNKSVQNTKKTAKFPLHTKQEIMKGKEILGNVEESLAFAFLPRKQRVVINLLGYVTNITYVYYPKLKNN